jgi:hypothetical protein
LLLPLLLAATMLYMAIRLFSMKAPNQSKSLKPGAAGGVVKCLAPERAVLLGLVLRTLGKPAADLAAAIDRIDTVALTVSGVNLVLLNPNAH